MALIDIPYLTTTTSISTQSDSKKVTVAIQQADLFHVTPLLGAPLKAQLEAGGEWGGNWFQLLDMVKPFFALAAQYELLLDTMVDIVAKGTLQPEGTAPEEIVKLRRDDIKGKMLVLRDRIVAHLAAHADEFGTAAENPAAPTQYTGLILLETPPVRFGG